MSKPTHFRVNKKLTDGDYMFRPGIWHSLGEDFLCEPSKESFYRWFADALAGGWSENSKEEEYVIEFKERGPAYRVNINPMDAADAEQWKAEIAQSLMSLVDLVRRTDLPVDSIEIDEEGCIATVHFEPRRHPLY